MEKVKLWLNGLDYKMTLAEVDSETALPIPIYAKTAYREFQSSECDNWPPEKHVFFVVEVI